MLKCIVKHPGKSPEVVTVEGMDDVESLIDSTETEPLKITEGDTGTWYGFVRDFGCSVLYCESPPSMAPNLVVRRGGKFADLILGSVVFHRAESDGIQTMTDEDISTFMPFIKGEAGVDGVTVEPILAGVRFAELVRQGVIPSVHLSNV